MRNPVAAIITALGQNPLKTLGFDKPREPKVKSDDSLTPAAVDPNQAGQGGDNTSPTASPTNLLLDKLISSKSAFEALGEELPPTSRENLAMYIKAAEVVRTTNPDQRKAIQDELRALFKEGDEQGLSLRQVTEALFKSQLVSVKQRDEQINTVDIISNKLILEHAALGIEEAERLSLGKHLQKTDYHVMAKTLDIDLKDLAKEVLREREDKDLNERTRILAGAIQGILQQLLPADQTLSARDLEFNERLASLTLEHMAAHPEASKQVGEKTPSAAPPAASAAAPSADSTLSPPSAPNTNAPRGVPAPTNKPATEDTRQLALSTALLGRNGKIDYADAEGNIKSLNIRRMAVELIEAPHNRALSNEQKVEILSAQIYAACAEQGHFIATTDPAETVFPKLLAQLEINRHLQQKQVALVDQALSATSTKNVAGIDDLSKAAEHIYSSALGSRSMAEQIEALATHIRNDHWAKRGEAARAQLPLINAGSVSNEEAFGKFGAAALQSAEQLQFSKLLAERIIERFPKKEIKVELPAEIKPESSIVTHVKGELAVAETLKRYQQIVINAAAAINTEAGKPSGSPVDPQALREKSKALILESWPNKDANSGAYAQEFARQTVESFRSSSK